MSNYTELARDISIDLYVDNTRAINNLFWILGCQNFNVMF